MTLEEIYQNIKITEAGCWEWLRARTPKGRLVSGYGRVSYKGRAVLTHRLMWTLLKSPIPPGKLVLHKCDNPPCCNPKHLFLGTYYDNAMDCVRKNRVSRKAVPKPKLGETNGMAKLTTSDVISIRGDSRSNVDIAKEYGVHSVTIAGIRSGRQWRHL